MRFLPVNLDSLLIELDSLDDTLALYASLRLAALPGITELVPAARTLLVHFMPWHTPVRTLCQTISRLPIVADGNRPSATVTVPVTYEGEDLRALAEGLGMSVSQLIAHHQDVCWKVAFTGFAPGFAYMVSQDWQWQIPRRSTPRTRIPAGALALAGEFSGIYPQASPGGWQLIGHTREAMWDLSRTPPALLQPGADVHFVAEGDRKIISLPGTQPVPSEDTTTEAPALTILAGGLQTTWQDRGREGQAAMGVGPAGARDRSAWRRANGYVGNPLSHGALEITLGNLRARAGRDIVVAVSGATCALSLRVDGQVYALPMEQPFAMAAGDELHIGPARQGVASYLAIRGVLPPAQQLGSVSFDTLARIGPAPLKTGDRIGIDPRARSGSVTDTPAGIPVLPVSGETVTLDIVAGPRTDWFDDRAIGELTDQVWQVTEQSNRIGLRLNGEKRLSRSQHQELPSEGTVVGAIQVPASGQPVLFLNDHPLTGGYPVIAAVAPHHRDLAGQIPPGCGIHFNLIQPFSPLRGEPEQP